MSAQLLHATCVAVEGEDGPLGVLLRGPSGAGKSDLALRLIDRGARLVADDQCELRLEDGAPGRRLVACAPEALAGKMEVRGLGIVEVAHLAQASCVLLVDLVAPEVVERLPEPASEPVLAFDLPRIALDAFEAAAPAKVELAARRAAGTCGNAPAGRSGVADDSPRASQIDEVANRGGGARRVVLVTGMSGAGRSTALKILEDLGYEAIDNLPLDLLERMVGEGGPLALGIDIRTRSFAAAPVLEQIDQLHGDATLAVTLLFLDCDDEVLERRFTETRRRHPLAQERRVADGIAAERRLVAPLRARADLTLDSSKLTTAELRRVLSGHLGLEQGPGMTIFVTSFSYRFGLPREADLVLDVRFLSNPHYDADLRNLDGRDPRVMAYIERDPTFAGFMTGLTGMLGPLLPRYEREGKSYLTIAVGCTGGRHRSVAVAERLERWLQGLGRRVNLSHRDIGLADRGADGVPAP